MSEYKTKLVIATIDFGTTYSGYAYSFQHTLKRDPLKVYGNIWCDDNGTLHTGKAPTTVLFGPDGKFHSFGYDAERTYADLADVNKHHGWKYFKRFKMKLHGNTRLRRDMKLIDDQGKRMLAIDVFAAAIGFLKDQLFEQLQLKVKDINKSDIHWVMTVPAIWQYSAKQFMKEASLKAGIPKDQLTFALEPEAAAIFCKQYEVSKCEYDGMASIREFAPGTQFMVLDMGGGTVDITVSEVQVDGALKELYPPSGGHWGGTLVDDELYDFFENIFGSKVWKQFKKEKKLNYLELTVTLELKKRQCKSKASTDIKILLPRSLCDLYKEVKGVDLDSDLSEGRFAKTVKLADDKLRVNNSEFVKMFESPKSQILAHLKQLFALPELKNVSMLMMVGGFSESSIMQEAVKEMFPDKNVIIPMEAGTVVMKGAVMYGFNKEHIRSRKLPFTYGISTAVPFDPKIHPTNMKFLNDFSQERVEDVFHEFIKKGQTVIVGKSQVEHSFMTPRDGEATVEVYQTPADILPDPSYVYQPEFERIGELRLSPLKHGRQQIDVTMEFGETDLEVEAKEHGTNNKVKAEFDFLL